MSRSNLFMLAGLLVGTLALAGVSPTEAAQSSLQRTNAGSGSYMMTPAMIHAIDVIVAEKTKMMHRRR